MNDRFKIRFAEEKDLVWVGFADFLYEEAAQRQKIDRKEIIVCDDDGRITGVLRYSMFWDYIPFINFIWVEEGFREERRASSMIRFLEEETRGRNYQRIMTSTQSNENAQGFFRKSGFLDAGGFAMQGQNALELIMIKYL